MLHLQTRSCPSGGQDEISKKRHGGKRQKRNNAHCNHTVHGRRIPRCCTLTDMSLLTDRQLLRRQVPCFSQRTSCSCLRQGNNIYCYSIHVQGEQRRCARQM